MTNKETIPNAEALASRLKGELIVLGTASSTNEAEQKALIAVRKAILKATPTISPEEIVNTVSELSKLIEGSRQAIAGSRMRTHLQRRGELKKPKLSRR